LARDLHVSVHLSQGDKDETTYLIMAADQEAGFAQHSKPTRRDAFLQTMESIVPWASLCAVIGPPYRQGGQ
jgi:hypothetical protein